MTLWLFARAAAEIHLRVISARLSAADAVCIAAVPPVNRMMYGTLVEQRSRSRKIHHVEREKEGGGGRAGGETKQKMKADIRNPNEK